MARHINQRAFTVNTKRVNENPQPPRQAVSRASRKSNFDDLMPEVEETETRMYAGANLQLLLTGQYRAGVGH